MMSIRSMKSITVFVLACAALQLHANTETVDGIVWTYHYDIYSSGLVEIESVELETPGVVTTGDVTVPSALGNQSVWSIGDAAFDSCVWLRSLTIPESVMWIGDDAFTGCSGLTNVVIGSADVYIGDYAFTSCRNLQTVYLPDGSSELAGAFPSWAEIVYYGGSEPEPTPQEVVISFDANGAEGDVPGVIECMEGDVVTLPNAGNLTLVGHTFSGWNYDGALFLPGANFEAGSTNVVLTAVWTKDVDPINAALDNGVLEFETGGATPWFVTNAVYKTGGSSMRSGAIGNGTNTWIETTVHGEGEVSFWLKASSEVYKGNLYDFATFTVDGVEFAKLGGEAEWTSFSFEVSGEGPHVLRWTYLKDQDDFAGEDCAWLDEVVWTPSAPPRPFPELPYDATSSEVAAAFDGAVDVALAVNIVDVTNYNAFCEWADSVKAASGVEIAGAQAVKESGYAWLSYALGADRLIASDMTDGDVKVESLGVSAEGSGAVSFSLEVSLADIGIGAGVEITQDNRNIVIENLAKALVAEGAATLVPPVGKTVDDVFSSEGIDIVFDVPLDGKARFSVRPPDGVGDTYFIRVKVK